MGANRSESASKGSRFLLCRAGARIAALPIEHVIETMRPLPIEPLATRARAVLGAAIVRGRAVPVVSVAAAMAADEGSVGRFVTISAAGRTVALAVESVLGIDALSGLAEPLPPLLSEADAVRSLRVLDDALAMVLDSALLVPEDVWSSIA